MSRTRRTVYLIKALSWHYNDECTIPGSAGVHRAFARKQDAEKARLRLELACHNEGSPGEPPTSGINLDDEVLEARLREFGLPAPPMTDDEAEYPFYLWGDDAWHERAEEQLGTAEYLRFFDGITRPYYYHVVETELEL